MIKEILKQNSLQAKDFCKYAKLSKTQYDRAMKKNDPIYIKGLESKLLEFIKWKIEQLKGVIDDKT